MTQKEKLSKSKKDSLSEFAKKLTDMKRQHMISQYGTANPDMGFYKTWIDKTLSNLEIYTFYFTTCMESHADEYPEWKQTWNDGQIPHLVSKVDQADQAPPKRKTVYRSWDDYFHRQRGVVNAFLKSGEIDTFCKELWWYIREIVADKRTNYILKKWHSLILDVACSAHLAKSPAGLLYEIDSQMSSFDRVIHCYWGWHHQIAPMLPDYELGKNRRENLRGFGKHKRNREPNEDIEVRNEKICRAAKAIQEKCKREKSILQIATILSKPPYNFLSVNDKPLSIRQIRKIIS
jgi:hypothetical protein